MKQGPLDVSRASRWLALAGVVVGLALAVSPARAGGTLTDCNPEDFSIAISTGGLVNFASSDCTVNLGGPITIVSNTVIDATGHTIIVDGGSNRIFNVSANVSLTLIGLRLTNGRSTNGGALFINPGATVVLTNCVLSGNGAIGPDGTNGISAIGGGTIGNNGGSATAGLPGRGGAIFNLGSLTLRNCTLDSNFTFGGNGGSGGNGADGTSQGGNGGTAGNGGLAYGGAIFNGGTLVLRDSTISSNAVSAGNGGAGGTNGSGPFAGNTGSGAPGGVGAGGGIYSTQSVTAINCTFVANDAEAGGSGNGITKPNSTGTAGFNGADAMGGGISSLSTVILTNCTFVDNRAIAGRGGNGGSGQTQGGIGGSGGNATGGGLHNAGGATVVNCTFSDGSAIGGTNGVAGGGAFPTSNGLPGAARGGNLGHLGTLLTLKNSIIATNASGGGGYGTITDAGNNISIDKSLNFGANSFTNTNPKLGTLNTNGGPTRTMLLLAGSPAINAGDDAGAPSFDQRGIARPISSKSDIGAVEVAIPVITTNPGSRTNIAGSSVTFTVVATGDPTLLYRWHFEGSPLLGATTTSYTRSNLSTNDAGNYTVVVSNNFGAVTSSIAKLTILPGPPGIAVAPGNISVRPGASFNFGVVAGGTPPFAYQWRYNGGDIVGATATNYTRANAQPGDAGVYSVVITNLSGATNAQAQLFVLGSTTLAAPSGSRTNLTFNYNTTPGFAYVIEYKDELTNGVWTPLSTNVGTGGTLSFSTLVTNLPRRFFRVTVP